MRIVPLGGLGEVGMNCTVLEHEDGIVVIDCGLLFSDLEHLGVEFVIPDFAYLRDRKDQIKAIVITHGHEDHVGALPFAIKAGIRAPIYAPRFASLMIRERLKESGLQQAVELKPFLPGDRVGDFGPFGVQSVRVNHSIVDSCGLIIDTPEGKIVHTGDFKIDPTPYYGKPLDEAAFRKAGDEGVLLLLSDSTNVERDKHSLSERTVYEKFEGFFRQARGLVVVSMFASNIGRVGQVMELAGKLRKRVALSGRAMEQNIHLAMEAGYLQEAPGVLINVDDIDQYPRKDVIVLSTGSQGEARSALIRVSHGEHAQIELREGDLVLMSSKFIPGNEKPIGRMINNLFRQGAEVLYESVHDIHTSGHATRPELKQMLEWVRPKFFIPVHGEYRHLVHHAKLARETLVTPHNVLIAENGNVIELTRDSCQVVERMEEPRVLIEGRDGGDVTKLILKDRRQLGEKGVVVALLARNARSRRIMSDPEVISRGLASELIEGHLIDEAKKIVKKLVSEYEAESEEVSVGEDLQETIRVELRRFFNQNLGKKPVVLPVILDT